MKFLHDEKPHTKKKNSSPLKRTADCCVRQTICMELTIQSSAGQES